MQKFKILLRTLKQKLKNLYEETFMKDKILENDIYQAISVLPAESTELLETKHRPYLDNRFFDVSVKAQAEFVELKVVLQNQLKSFYYPVEARILTGDQELSVTDAYFVLIDFVDDYFSEYFADGNTFLPIDWAAFDSNGKKIQARGQITNSYLEELADRILAGENVAVEKSQDTTFFGRYPEQQS